MRDEALGGTGIGLALSRRLVELHGGEIGVTSEENIGRKFWFTIPIRNAPNENHEVFLPETKERVDYPINKSILVVEDNQTNLDMIKYLLSIYNHKISVARDGKEAITTADSIKPDLILMDIRMPIMNGLEATKILRSKENKSHIPIIALTASAGEDSREDCLKAGCTDHLSKPIHSRELFEVLGKYIK